MTNLNLNLPSNSMKIMFATQKNNPKCIYTCNKESIPLWNSDLNYFLIKFSFAICLSVRFSMLIKPNAFIKAKPRQCHPGDAVHVSAKNILLRNESGKCRSHTFTQRSEVTSGNTEERIHRMLFPIRISFAAGATWPFFIPLERYQDLLTLWT